MVWNQTGAMGFSQHALGQEHLIGTVNPTPEVDRLHAFVEHHGREVPFGVDHGPFTGQGRSIGEGEVGQQEAPEFPGRASRGVQHAFVIERAGPKGGTPSVHRHRVRPTKPRGVLKQDLDQRLPQGGGVLGRQRCCFRRSKAIGTPCSKRSKRGFLKPVNEVALFSTVHVLGGRLIFTSPVHAFQPRLPRAGHPRMKPAGRPRLAFDGWPFVTGSAVKCLVSEAVRWQGSRVDRDRHAALVQTNAKVGPRLGCSNRAFPEVRRGRTKLQPVCGLQAFSGTPWQLFVLTDVVPVGLAPNTVEEHGRLRCCSKRVHGHWNGGSASVLKHKPRPLPSVPPFLTRPDGPTFVVARGARAP
jgi:hypothetical protein